MSKRRKWLIITLCEIVALAIMTVGCQLLFHFVFGPVLILVVVFIIYGIGRVWTREKPQENGENE